MHGAPKPIIQSIPLLPLHHAFTMPTADPVTTLDGDILLDIAGYLSISDLASAACVSRAWRGFFRGQDRLWRSQYLGLKDVDSGLRWRHKIEGRERERRGEDPVDWHALCELCQMSWAKW